MTQMLETLDPVVRRLRPLLSALRVGDSTADFTANSLTHAGDAWQDNVVPLLSAHRLGFSDPTVEKFIDDGSGSTGIYLTHFSATLTNEVVLSFQGRHATDGMLSIHVHWAPTTADVGNVVWELEHVKSSRSEATGVSTVTQVIDAASGVAKQEQITSLYTYTGLEDSDIVVCRLARLGGDAADTYPEKIAGLSADGHQNLNRLGSETQYPDAG
jgi:hypothetical protein